MKVSELIKRLERLKTEHGDIDIVDASDRPFQRFTIVDESGRFKKQESVGE